MYDVKDDDNAEFEMEELLGYAYTCFNCHRNFEVHFK